MVYQVLARGWRPQRFEDVIGQDAVVMTLKNALQSGTLGHAYLFSGLRGVGKTTAARLLAKAVNCAEGPTATPCGQCDACTEIAEGSSIDVLEVDGASNRKIDDVRELRDMLRYRPTRDRFRVIIIDEVHMLTREAFNALLKSLEEPPPYIMFILATTERQKVPSTILSRCQQLEFRAVSARLIADRLMTIAEGEGFSLTRQAADAIARAAEGSVRDGLSLLDQLRAFSQGEISEESVAEVLGVPQFDAVIALLGVLARGDLGQGLARLRDELASGHDPVVLYQETGRALRMAMHLDIDPELEPGLTDEQKTLIQEQLAEVGSDGLARMLGLWLEHELLVREAGNRELALEVACLRLSRWPSVQRLEAFLESGGTAGPATSSGGGGQNRSRASSSPQTQGSRSGAPVASEHARTREEESNTASATPGGRLAEAFWNTKAQDLAAAVESADVRLDGHRMVMVFRGENEAFGRVIEQRRPEVEAMCHKLFPEVDRLELESQGETSMLATMVAEDEKVQLVQRIIGGEIVRIESDETVQ